jgi:hypothetical protein
MYKNLVFISMFGAAARLLLIKADIDQYQDVGQTGLLQLLPAAMRLLSKPSAP